MVAAKTRWTYLHVSYIILPVLVKADAYRRAAIV